MIRRPTYSTDPFTTTQIAQKSDAASRQVNRGALSFVERVPTLTYRSCRWFLGRKNQMYDQRQQGEQYKIKKFGFVCHKTLQLLQQRPVVLPYRIGANVMPPFGSRKLCLAIPELTRPVNSPSIVGESTLKKNQRNGLGHFSHR